MILLRIIALTFVLVLSFNTAHSQNLTKYINPFIGTGGHGHTFPGSTLPFALVQLSPDTRIDGTWDGCSGYHYSDSIIYGFSHTHLSGTGVSDYGDIAFMSFFDDNISKDNIESAISNGVSFSHKNENALAGYYSVILNNGVKVELTSTLRAGIQRYTFPNKGKAYITLNLKHRDKLIQGVIDKMDSTTYQGQRTSTSWAERQTVYYYFQVSQSPVSDKIVQGKNGDELLIMEFNANKNEEILIQTGISGTDIGGAIRNLETEVENFEFDRARINANAIWNNKMSSILTYGGSEEEKTIFYTALYHCMIHPSIFSDVDGRYRGRDGKLHLAQNDDKFYTVFSLWDTYRALHPLLSIIEVKKTNEFIISLLRNYEQAGRLPVWELWSNETNCMIGYHAVSVIWDTYNKGIRSFHTGNALRSMISIARDTTNPALKSYIKYGYVRAEDDAESVSKTLEYAYNDWCIAQMAKSFNATKTLNEFTKRSRNWINVFDPTTGFMRPRLNSTLLTPFSPYMVDNHYTEANSYQYSFYVPHDLKKFKEMVGGDIEFEKKLNELFSADSETEGRDQADITGLIGQYAHGNEPSHHIAFLYTDRAKRTKMVDYIRKNFYKNSPDGLIGNEDCGQMSAWYVMAAIGMYPICPGDKRMAYVDGVFDSVKIKSDIWTITRRKYDSSEFFNLYGQDLSLPDYELDLQRQPYIMPCKRIFKNKQWIKLAGGKNIVYAINSGPYQRFKDSILIDKTCNFQFYNVIKNKKTKTQEASFHKLPNDRSIQLKYKYKKEYHAGGPMALLDGIVGSANWRKGDWHGYQKNDFEAVIKFDSVKNFSFLKMNFLQDQRAWIFYPRTYQISYSLDGIHFKELLSQSLDISRNEEQATIHTAQHKFDIKAKYIKIFAKQYGKLPSWHPGHGGDSYIFIDEIGIQ